MFLEPYHAPYTIKCRYWTGLLLLVRILLYITSSVTLSIDPRINIMITGIITLLLWILSTNKVYKKQHIKLLEILSFANIASLCIASLYFFKSHKGQEVVTYISGSVTFGLLITVIAYHFLTEIRFKTMFGIILKWRQKYSLNDRDNDSEEEINPISSINNPQDSDERILPTHSVVELPHLEKSVFLNEERVKEKDKCELKIQSSVNNYTPYYLMK